MKSLYIGLMSGTSLDGIEAVLADFSGTKLQQIDLIHHDFRDDLRQSLLEIFADQEISLVKLGQTHTELGEVYAKIVQDLLQKNKTPTTAIKAIGNHGQTIFHHPHPPHPFTLQIGNNSVLAARTQIPVVGDFRSLDMAYGGQGAPLAPLFHQAFFAKPKENIAVLNLGGIANVSILKDGKLIAAFDTGPGNGLLDAFMQRYFKEAYDRDGAKARTGKLDSALLQTMLQDPYFAKAPPKSTGKEYFNLNTWQLKADLDTLRTLTELTALSISNALIPYAIQQIIVTGGGAFNTFLVERLAALSPKQQVINIANMGIHPQAIEPLAFAWLAKMRIENHFFDLSEITGSARPLRLGQIFLP